MPEDLTVPVAIGDRVDYWPVGSRPAEHHPRLGLVVGLHGALVDLQVMEPSQQRQLRTKVLSVAKAGCASPRAGGA